MKSLALGVELSPLIVQENGEEQEIIPCWKLLV